ncbi:MAG: iron ABC transporter permease, partial [Dactylosporangium sp.]|nr:iron ABC transporter permease [Dactylosporangium sp.]NNJ62457.1 iron ABC transporter permease [Dactylosporangium sp.]
GLALGPVRLPPGAVAVELLNQLPYVQWDSGLTARETAIVTQLRLPRVVLGLLVGATLAVAGGCYQGVFRNPLADPYFLGVSAGAGLGATVAIISSASEASGSGGTSITVPPAAFVGALGAVALTYALGAVGARSRSPATLLLAGIAVTAFLTAAQTFLQQHHIHAIREVYSWLLGRLATAGWHDVLLLLPYSVVSIGAMLLARRTLDVLAVGDTEATSLGMNPRRVRYLLLVTASLGTAAAVSVSGLIGFVGIIVPHLVRLLFGTAYRVILPLSALLGAAFLATADLAARTVLSPAEIPIGVVTALAGAPFFVLVLRTTRRVSM